MKCSDQALLPVLFRCLFNKISVIESQNSSSPLSQKTNTNSPYTPDIMIIECQKTSDLVKIIPCSGFLSKQKTET